MQKNKKLILIGSIFIFLLLVIPLIQSFVFSTSTIQNSKIVINKEIKASFLKNIDKENIVLFFGYVGCSEVCMPILTELNTLFSSDETEKIKNSTVVVFVNLTSEISHEQPQIFASFFNENFIGLYLTKKDLYEVDRKFSLFYSAGINDKNELSHSDFIYLLQKQSADKAILKNIYMTHPLNSKELIKDIKSIL